MRSDYRSITKPDEYWNGMLQTDSGQKEIILMLLDKIDRLNDRVYEAQVRAEDAYNEMMRLRNEVTAMQDK